MKKGLILYRNSQLKPTYFRELLLLAKYYADGKTVPFSFADHETSLHQQMSLWENIQLETGFRNWNEVLNHTKEHFPYLSQIKMDLEKKVSDSTSFEIIFTSFLKAQFANNEVTIVEISDHLYTEKELKFLQKFFVDAGKNKKIYLRSTCPDSWENVADDVVEKHDHQFQSKKQIRSAA